LWNLPPLAQINARPKPPGFVNLPDVAHLRSRSHIVGRVGIVVENKPSSLLREIDLVHGVIDPEGILQAGEVGSDQDGLMGKCEGRSVIIKGIDIEIATDKRAIPVVELADSGIFSIRPRIRDRLPDK